MEKQNTCLEGEVMEWISFLSGFLTAALTYVVFSDKGKEKLEVAADIEDHIEYDDTTGRIVTMMCVSCRKQRRHKEVEPDLYECTRCKRQTDLRR